jgi:hypothetical protein
VDCGEHEERLGDRLRKWDEARRTGGEGVAVKATTQLA